MRTLWQVLYFQWPHTGLILQFCLLFFCLFYSCAKINPAPSIYSSYPDQLQLISARLCMFRPPLHHNQGFYYIMTAAAAAGSGVSVSV